MRIILGSALLIAVAGCSFPTLDDSRALVAEAEAHGTADGGLTREQLTQQLVVISPENGEALLAIGDEQADKAAMILAASRKKISETGVGSVDQTIGWAVGGLLGLIGTGLGVSNKLGKSRFVKLIDSFDQKKKAEHIAEALSKAANGSTT